MSRYTPSVETSASKEKADQVEVSQSAKPVGIVLPFLVGHSGRVHGNDRQTDSRTKYCNPRTCAPRVSTECVRKALASGGAYLQPALC